MIAVFTYHFVFKLSVNEEKITPHENVPAESSTNGSANYKLNGEFDNNAFQSL